MLGKLFALFKFIKVWTWITGWLDRRRAYKRGREKEQYEAKDLEVKQRKRQAEARDRVGRAANRGPRSLADRVRRGD